MGSPPYTPSQQLGESACSIWGSVSVPFTASNSDILGIKRDGTFESPLVGQYLKLVPCPTVSDSMVVGAARVLPSGVASSRDG